MVCSKRLRISYRENGGVSDFLSFSNFNHTLDKEPIIFPRILSIAKELFLFFSLIDLLKLVHFLDLVQVVWYGIYFTYCVVKTFLWDVFLKLCVYITSDGTGGPI